MLFADGRVLPASLPPPSTVRLSAALDGPSGIPGSVNYFRPASHQTVDPSCLASGNLWCETDFRPTFSDALATRDHPALNSLVPSLEFVDQDLYRPQQQFEHTVDLLGGPESQTLR